MAAHDKMDHDIGRPFQDRIRNSGFDAASRSRTSPPATTLWPRHFPAGAIRRRTAPTCSTRSVTRMGIAAVYAPKSKYKVFWSLILAAGGEPRG